MDILKEQLHSLIQRLVDTDGFQDQLEHLISIFPFNKYEFIIAKLLNSNKISYDEYILMRKSYIDRNLYLSLFEISAPRGFGDTWALGHLMSINPEFLRPTKQIDTTYKGEYDLLLNWHDNTEKDHLIKIEVKASRAVDRKKPDEPLYEKALASDSNRPFLMNYQQMKPQCCDVFIWIAVYRDKIKYWIIPSRYIQIHEDFTPQHRNEKTVNCEKIYIKEDIYEGQLMITQDNIHKFNPFTCLSTELTNRVIIAYKRQKGL
jgi:hypothetical protein